MATQQRCYAHRYRIIHTYPYIHRVVVSLHSDVRTYTCAFEKTLNLYSPQNRSMHNQTGIQCVRLFIYFFPFVFHWTHIPPMVWHVNDNVRFSSAYRPFARHVEHVSRRLFILFAANNTCKQKSFVCCEVSSGSAAVVTVTNEYIYNILLLSRVGGGPLSVIRTRLKSRARVVQKNITYRILCHCIYVHNIFMELVCVAIGGDLWSVGDGNTNWKRKTAFSGVVVVVCQSLRCACRSVVQR